MDHYNEGKSKNKLLLKNNVFIFLINKIDSSEQLKKLCLYCYSYPILFNCLFLKFEKVDNLLNKNKIEYDDIPLIIRIGDNLIELIQKYKKIDCFFGDSIIKVWKRYIDFYNKDQNFESLIQIKDKFKEIEDNENINNLKAEINGYISSLGKKKIIYLKGIEMYKFIYQYNNFCHFLSDKEDKLDKDLLYKIGQNINLDELSKDSNSLEEFNKCDFLNKIDIKNISDFINGVISLLNKLDDIYIFFKYIFPINKEKTNKKKIIFITLFDRFLFLLDKLSNHRIDFTEKNQEVFQNMILLSIIYTEDQKKQVIHRNFREEFFIKLKQSSSFKRYDLTSFLIEKIINNDFEIYIPKDKKDEINIFILGFFYFGLDLKQKISLLLKFNSLELKKNHIYCTFDELKFDNIISIEDTPSFVGLQEFVEKKIIEKDKECDFFKKLIESCNKYRDILENKKINFFELDKLKELKSNKKLPIRVQYICLGDLSASKILTENIENYINKYSIYYQSLDKLIIYYNKYYPKSKINEINNFTDQKTNFYNKDKKLCDFEIKENSDEEVKRIEKYDKSNFFLFFIILLKIKKKTKILYLKNPLNL